MKELKIDPELRDLLPPITNEEYKQLEKNILKNGFDKNFPIMEWNGFIVDGHNRYDICKKNNVTDYTVGTLAYKTKEEVMEWMLDIQLGRRNLSPIQRIAVAEKYRPIYERQAKENQSKAGKEYGNGSEKLSQNSSKATFKENKIDVRAKLAETANVSTDTYSKGKKILDSDNDEVKEAVLSGDMSINAGYNKIRENEKKKENIKEESSNTDTQQTTPPLQTKPQISDEVKQICADLKTEKTKEYLDSVWDYKISIIKCMNADFEMYYDGFVSTLNDMENRVTKRELDECIANAESNVEKLLIAIELAQKTTLKTED